MIDKLELKENVTEYGYVPHKAAVSNLIRAGVLWMISNFPSSHKQVKSGKLFEYFGAGKPILDLVHGGESSKLLKEYTSGFFGNLDDNESIIEQIGNIYQKWEQEDLPESSKEFMEKFDRRKIT